MNPKGRGQRCKKERTDDRTPSSVLSNMASAVCEYSSMDEVLGRRYWVRRTQSPVTNDLEIRDVLDTSSEVPPPPSEQDLLIAQSPEACWVVSHGRYQISSGRASPTTTHDFPLGEARGRRTERREWPRRPRDYHSVLWVCGHLVAPGNLARRLPDCQTNLSPRAWRAPTQ